MLKKVLEQGRENADAALERLLPPELSSAWLRSITRQGEAGLSC